jgi:DNA modification methylase
VTYGIVLEADAQAIPLASDSVDCIVTSPPYYGLRNYSGEQVRRWPDIEWRPIAGLEPLTTARMDCAFGAEERIWWYVAHTVAVCRSLRRVLKPSGTLWWNIGDCYNGSGGAGGDYGPGGIREGQPRYKGRRGELGLKNKDMMGVPWRVAFALQADGWWLRMGVVWNKTSAMPEPGFDRPVVTHEFIFMLTKKPRYYYDWFGVLQKAKPETWGAPARGEYRGQSADGIEESKAQNASDTKRRILDAPKRPGSNLRSVWTFPTASYSGEHFAVFPDDLPDLCIRASTSRRGNCPVCGKPWVRIISRVKANRDIEAERQRDGERTGRTDGKVMGPSGIVDRVDSVGWKAQCDHGDAPVPPIVLDPFFGSGTTGRVAKSLSCRFVGLDVSRDYIETQAKPRALGTTPIGALDNLPLFGGPLDGTVEPLPPDPE